MASVLGNPLEGWLGSAALGWMAALALFITALVLAKPVLGVTKSQRIRKVAPPLAGAGVAVAGAVRPPMPSNSL